jgi:hypothetical protein
VSSTNRGKKGGGDSEFFPTSPWATRAILHRLARVLPCGRWLEPSAGDGAIIRVVNEWARETQRPPIDWTAIELRGECERALRDERVRHVVIAAFQRWAEQQKAFGLRWEVAILNPPFSQADVFVRALLELADHVVCLQRSPWIGDAEDRLAFFREHMPDEYRIGRVDFDGRGGDSVPYSWFHWQHGNEVRSEGRLVLLDRPPAAERRERGEIPPARQPGLFD